MFMYRLMHDYVMIKKSTICFTILLAGSIAGYYFYKRHHSELARDVNQFADDLADTAKKGVRKAKEVSDTVKA